MTIPPTGDQSTSRRVRLQQVPSIAKTLRSFRAIHASGALSLGALFVGILFSAPSTACIQMPGAEMQQLDAFRRKDPEQAIAIAARRLQEAGATPSLDRAQLYSIIAFARGNENRAADARAALNDARLELSRLPASTESHELGLLFTEIEYDADVTQSEYERGLQQLNASLASVEGGTRDWACLLKARAGFQFQLGKTDLAVADALTAYRLAKTNHWDDIAAYSALELAAAYRRAGLWSAADQMIAAAKEYLTRNDLTYWLSMAEYTSAAIYVGQGQWQAAFEAFDRSVRLKSQLGDHLAVGIAGIFLCDRLLDAGRLADAEARCPRSAEVFETAKRNDLVVRLAYANARIELAKHQYRKALVTFQDMARNHVDDLPAAMLPGLYQDLASALGNLGQDREARIALERSIAARRDLNEAAQVRAAAIMSGIQKSDALQATNEQLERENRYRHTQERVAAGVVLGALIAVTLLAKLLHTQIRLRRELARQAALLTTLTSNLSDTVLLVDGNLRVLFANRSLRVGAGPPTGELLADVVPSGDSNQFTTAVDAVLASRKSAEFYSSWQGIDGTMRHYEQLVTPVLDGSTLVGVTVRSTDVTSRRNLETAMRLQARILDTMNDGVLVLTKRGRITVANLAMHTVLGAHPGSLIGTSIQSRFADDRATAQLATLISGAGSSTREVALMRDDDSACLVSITTATLDVDGDRVFVWACRDITWQRRIERAVLGASGRDATSAAVSLHEGLAQELVGVSLYLGSTVQQLKSEKVANTLKTAAAHLTTAISTAKDLARLISPMTTVRGSVGDALSRLCEEAGAAMGVPVEYVEMSCPFEVSTATGDQIYRITDEALTAARGTHGCEQIRVSVSTSDTEFRIDIRWSGAQVVAANTQTFVRDLELDLIAYRARLLGGTSEHGRWEGGEFLAVSIPIFTEDSGFDSGGFDLY